MAVSSYSVMAVIGLALCLGWHRTLSEQLNLPTAIVLCFDGYRWDYLHEDYLINFRKFMSEGVHAHSMRSSYLTKTFPNLITLVTGLHPESHGIVSNRMYDPVFQETSSYTTTDSKWYEDFEPIWITNERDPVQNTSEVRRSAVIQWGAANVQFKRGLPWYYEGYNASHTAHQGFNRIIHLLKNSTRPNLIVAYFEELDAASHKYGPMSAQLRNTLLTLDLEFGNFLKELEGIGLNNQVNIIIVSDHGMADVDNTSTVYISNILHPSLYLSEEIGASALIWPRSGKGQKVYQALKLSEHIDTYKREEIPERFYYKRHRRIPPVLVIAHQGWTMARNRGDRLYRGHHGYDNMWNMMDGIFMARGPAFKKGMKIGTFKNIHIYPMLCHILGIKPLPNNGSLGILKSVVSASSSLMGIRNAIAFMSFIAIAFSAL